MLQTRLAYLALVGLLGACAAGDPAGPNGSTPDARGGDDVTGPDAGAISTPDAATPTPDAATQSTPAADCFANAFVNPTDLGPDYDQFGPTVGNHCFGTHHQNIVNVERVVFLGDSVTVGTPPTGAGDFYRSRLAARLATKFGLDAPNFLWEQANPLDGTAGLQSSGDFASCAKWGARTDDLLEDNAQIESCFPVSERGKRTLVVMTIGGNDIAAITKDGSEGKSVPELWADTEAFVQKLRHAVNWFYEDPSRFPNGVYIVFANMFEFTDATGDTDACPAAGLAGFGDAWEDFDAQAGMVIWANEQYMDIAVQTGTDMVFVLESFCGHGFNNDNPESPCYRGPGTARWLDDTCIHPNPLGHEKMADMFMAVING